MRLLWEPIELLYQQVQIGTPVHIIHYPNKAGWHGDELYLESHKPVDSYVEKPASELNKIDAASVIYEAIHLRPAHIHWNLVDQNIHDHLGILEPIGHKFSITDPSS